MTGMTNHLHRLVAWIRPAPREALMRCHGCGHQQHVPVRAITVYVTTLCREWFAVTRCDTCHEVMANQIGGDTGDLLLNNGARMKAVPTGFAPTNIRTEPIREIA